MKRNQLKFLAIITLTLFSGLAISQEAKLDSYKYPQGKTFVETTQVVSDISQSMMGREMKIKSDVTATSELFVETVNPSGEFTIQQTLKNTRIGTSGMGKDTVYNLEDINEVSKIAYSSVGNQLSITKSDTPSKFNVMGGMNQFSRLPILPGRSIKAGEKWNEKLQDSTQASASNPASTKIITEMEYTFIGVESKDGVEYNKVQYSGSMAVTGTGNQMGMDLFIEGTGKSQGYYLFDKLTNMAVFSDGLTELDMSIAVTGQQNFNIPMTQSMKTQMKLEEKK